MLETYIYIYISSLSEAQKNLVTIFYKSYITTCNPNKNGGFCYNKITRLLSQFVLIVHIMQNKCESIYVNSIEGNTNTIPFMHTASNVNSNKGFSL